MDTSDASIDQRVDGVWQDTRVRVEPTLDGVVVDRGALEAVAGPLPPELDARLAPADPDEGLIEGFPDQSDLLGELGRSPGLTHPDVPDAPEGMSLPDPNLTKPQGTGGSRDVVLDDPLITLPPDPAVVGDGITTMAGTRPDGRPYTRPTLRAGTRQRIQEAAPRASDGRFINPHDAQPIPLGQEQYGHVYGREHWRLSEEAEQLGLTQQEFNDWVNDHPEWFQMELKSDNESHRFEKPKDQP